MNCCHCQSNHTRSLNKATVLGYQQFICSDCGKQFNERSGTSFNFIMYPTAVVMMVIYYYYRFKVSLYDVVELMLMRGFHLTHQTVHNWVHRFGPELGIKLRSRRYKKASDRWHVDCTYLRIEGRWCYLYRAIDNEGNLVDVYLSDVRNQHAVETVNFLLPDLFAIEKSLHRCFAVTSFTLMGSFVVIVSYPLIQIQL